MLNSSNNLNRDKERFREEAERLRSCENLKKRISYERMRDSEDRIFQRDFARILYSPSFRRMQGKMQLLGIKGDEYYRNRLTHSLEVSQIARSIAEIFGYEANEYYVVEAGSLAHDIGNPPFGHSGERCLNKLFDDIGGYEGNAQTLRILTKIENKKTEFRGLNLTYRTLFSVLKYNKKRKEQESCEKNKKFIYDDNYEKLQKFVVENDISVRTLDVQIVDKSDEIAYAAHDLEDGLRQHYFTIDEIVQEFSLLYPNSEVLKKLELIVEECRDKSGYLNRKNASIYQQLFRQELTSMIVYELIHDLGMWKVDQDFKNKTGTTNEYELNFISLGDLANGLKKAIFNCIMNKNDVHLYEKKGNIILETLKEIYEDDPKLMSPNYQIDVVKNSFTEKNMDKNILKKRLVCDYISGMMDSYAISEYEKYTGISFEKIKLHKKE